MKLKILFGVCAVALLSASQTAASQIAMPTFKHGASTFNATGSVLLDSSGNDATDTTNHAVKVNCVTGCSGSGGGGGAVTAASGSYAVGALSDGADTTLGAKADSIYAGSGTASLISINKGIYSLLAAPLPAGTNTIGAISNTGFAATQSGTWNITNISGTISLPTGAATSANQPTNATIGSTTSGQTGTLIQGAVTTAAPTYTTAQTDPLSLTTGGSLRGDVSSYAGTALTGTVTAYGTAPTGNVYGVNASVTNTVAVGNVATIASSTPAYSVAAGSTNKAAAVTLGTAVSQVDQNATAFAGSGSVLGSMIASAQGGGSVVSAEINVSALTLGTATAVIFCLDESVGGTNTTDVWCSDPITATAILRVPAVPVAGRRMWRAFSVGGTSTTVTATITTMELPAGSYPVVRKFHDYYAATNPFATRYNSAALTASSLVLTTAGSATTPFLVESTKTLSAAVLLSGGPTVTTQPVLALQVSMDGSNWANVSGATITPAGNGEYVILGQTIAGAKFARVAVQTAAVYSAGSYTVNDLWVSAIN